MNRHSIHKKPVNPHTETAYFWNRSLGWIFFFDPTGLVNLCGRLKTDIFEVNYVINSGPVLNENFQVENGGQQCFDCNFACSYLVSPVLLHALKSSLLFWRQQLAISKEDLIRI